MERELSKADGILEAAVNLATGRTTVGYAPGVVDSKALVGTVEGVALATAVPLASDTLPIALMEAVDDLVVLVVPGAMKAGPLSLF